MAKPLVDRLYRGRSILVPEEGESRLGLQLLDSKTTTRKYFKKRIEGILHPTKGFIIKRSRVRLSDGKTQYRNVVEYKYKAPKYRYGGWSVSGEARKLALKVGLKEFGVPIPKKLHANIDNIMYVDVAPMWRYAKIRVRKNSAYDKTRNEMRGTRRIVYESTYYPQRKRNRNYLAKVFPRRNFNIAIRVGFIHPDAYHGSWVGRQIASYRSLIAGLLLKGYDPLLPLRDKRYLENVAKEMGRACGEAIEKGRSFESVLRKYGRDMQNYVYQYIIGGIKPSLADNTIQKRISLKKSGVFSYPRGIEEPLVETGEMADEVSFEFITMDLGGKQTDRDDYEATSGEPEEAEKSEPVAEPQPAQKQADRRPMTQWDIASRMAELQAQAISVNRGGLFGRGNLYE